MFICTKTILWQKESVSVNDLKAFPCVTYDRILRAQPFSGEVIAECPRKIGTTDRAATYSMLSALNAVVTGTSYVPVAEQQRNILARPLEDSYTIQLVYVVRKDYALTDLAKLFIDTISPCT